VLESLSSGGSFVRVSLNHHLEYVLARVAHLGQHHGNVANVALLVGDINFLLILPFE